LGLIASFTVIVSRVLATRMSVIIVIT